MRRCWSLLLFVVFLSPTFYLGGQSKEKPKWPPNPNIAASEPLRPEAQLKKFRLPPGFEIQLVAGDPDIRKPINIAFDAAGRLWVSETIEYPFAAAPGKGRDSVKVLEDFGPDGKARKITTFADKLNIPIGVLPLSTSEAIVYSIPSIVRMSDTTGAGKANERKLLFSGYGFQDTHGMTGEFVRGFDGWIYACHGFSNTSQVKDAAGKPTITMQSGNTYRFLPGGVKMEYFTHGQVNPFGICFDPLGNLYSADCHTQPIYQLLRGAYYPSFGRPDDGLGFGPQTITQYSESTAIAGINYYAADQYPAEYRDCAFIGDVVTNRVNMFRLTWTGSTPQAKLERFLQSDDPWFRPTDVKLGPDGCLYIADFYNRIIGHYELPLTHPGRDRDKGRIWRIVYRGPGGKGQPQPYQDLTKIGVAGLVKELGNANIAVRMHAADELVRRGGEPAKAAVAAVLAKGSAFQRAHGLWVLHRRGGLSDAALTAACADKDAIVRVHAQRVLTERAELAPKMRELVLDALEDADPFVQRCAAEALGRHSQTDNVKPLLELRQRVDGRDTHLLHVVRMALRDQLRSAETWMKFDFTKLADNDLRAIADVCPGVHNASSAAFLAMYLQKFGGASGDLPRYTHAAVRYGAPALVREVVDVIATKFPGDLAKQGLLLKIVQQASQERGLVAGVKEKAYAAALVNQLLASPKMERVQNGIELAGSFKLAEAQPQLLALARSPKAPAPLRKSAVVTAIALDSAKAIQALSEVLLGSKEPVEVREQVATALASTNWPEAHAMLLKTMEAAPARLQSVIAVGLATSPQGAERLLEAVGKGKASPRLLMDRAVSLRLEQAKVANLKDRLARLTKGVPTGDQRIAALIAKQRDGFLAGKEDPALGLKVYEKHCAGCHQIAGKGAKIGPQLDGVGIRGAERILEDVLDPNRNVDQAFRSTTLVLRNGQFVNGLVLREEGEVIVLADAQGKEVRLPKASVDERIVSQLSPMPSNFAEVIGEADMQHLLAYLLAQRAKE
jgi:putative heme-binding domain-containing protein